MSGPFYRHSHLLSFLEVSLLISFELVLTSAMNWPGLTSVTTKVDDVHIRFVGLAQSFPQSLIICFSFLGLPLTFT